MDSDSGGSGINNYLDYLAHLRAQQQAQQAQQQQDQSDDADDEKDKAASPVAHSSPLSPLPSDPHDSSDDEDEEVVEDAKRTMMAAWQPDTASSRCTICGARFGVLKRRHHCRQCGKLVCAVCSQWRRVLSWSDGIPVRVCGRCATMPATSSASSVPSAKRATSAPVNSSLAPPEPATTRATSHDPHLLSDTLVSLGLVEEEELVKKAPKKSHKSPIKGQRQLSGNASSSGAGSSARASEHKGTRSPSGSPHQRHTKSPLTRMQPPRLNMPPPMDDDNAAAITASPLPLDVHYPIKGHWQHDNSSEHCMRCLRKFTVLKRRHHCRGCGLLVCASCGNNKRILRDDGVPVRVCKACVAEFECINDDLSTTSATVTRNSDAEDTGPTSASTDEPQVHQTTK